MKTLILFLDAISFSDFNEKNFPFLHKLAKDGAYGAVDIVPSCYHTEYSMLSGCLPTKHNTWTWFYLKKNSSFSKIRYILPALKLLEKLKLKKAARNAADIYINLFRLFSGKTRFLKSYRIPFESIGDFEIVADKSYMDHNPLPVPTLFDVFREKGIKYCAMDYPTISNNKRTFFYLGKNDFKQLNRVEKLLKKYSVVYTHVWDLDAIEHKYGLHSREAFEHMKKLDERIRKIVCSSKEKINIAIFSDHGGCNVNKTKNILPLIKDYAEKYFIGSTDAQIWMKNPSQKEELKKKLRKEDYLIYDEKNIEKELKIPYKRDFVGDIMVAVNIGEQLYPDFFRDTEQVKSMHGYVKKTPELRGIFIANGFNLKTKNIKNMKLYDIMPTILKAMKIEIPEVCDGKPRVQ